MPMRLSLLATTIQQIGNFFFGYRRIIVSVRSHHDGLIFSLQNSETRGMKYWAEFSPQNDIQSSQIENYVELIIPNKGPHHAGFCTKIRKHTLSPGQYFGSSQSNTVHLSRPPYFIQTQRRPRGYSGGTDHLEFPFLDRANFLRPRAHYIHIYILARGGIYRLYARQSGIRRIDPLMMRIQTRRGISCVYKYSRIVTQRSSSFIIFPD